MTDQNTLDAFQTMWGMFPEPVLLVQKDRTILAVNRLAAQLGVQAGIRCFTLNPAHDPQSVCQRCRANQALQSQQAVCESTPDGIRGYWIPVENQSDLYIHFGIGTAEAFAQAQATPSQELVSLQ